MMKISTSILQIYRHRPKINQNSWKYKKNIFKFVLFNNLIYVWYNLSYLIIKLYVSIKNINFISIHLLLSCIILFYNNNMITYLILKYI